MDLIEGGVFTFKVVGKNKAGREVPVSGVTMALDNPALGTVSVNPDGTGGVFTAGSTDGVVNMSASNDAGLTSPPFPVTITTDNVAVSLEIQPDPAVALAITPT